MEDSRAGLDVAASFNTGLHNVRHNAGQRCSLFFTSGHIIQGCGSG